MTLKGKASPGIVLCVEGMGTIEVLFYVKKQKGLKQTSVSKNENRDRKIFTSDF